MAGDDFVMVRLTSAGEKHAAGAAMGVSAGNRYFVFKPGVPLRVEKSYEWRAVLSRYKHLGEHLFELAPAAAPTAEKTIAADQHVAAGPQ